MAPWHHFRILRRLLDTSLLGHPDMFRPIVVQNAGLLGNCDSVWVRFRSPLPEKILVLPQ